MRYIDEVLFVVLVVVSLMSLTASILSLIDLGPDDLCIERGGKVIEDENSIDCFFVDEINSYTIKQK
jgi:hypothetical protein